MALYRTDYSEYTDDVQLSDWTERWDQSSFHQTFARAGTTGIHIGEKYAEQYNAALGGRKLTTWDDIDGDADRDDVEILVRTAPQPKFTSGLYVVARGSGTSSTETAYLAGFRGTFGSSDMVLEIAKLNGGTFTQLSSTPMYIESDRFRWLRFRVNGTDLKAASWDERHGTDGSWDIETTDSDVSGTGWVGHVHFTGSNGIVAEHDYFCVATAGDTAAGPVVTETRLYQVGIELAVSDSEVPAGDGGLRPGIIHMV